MNKTKGLKPKDRKLATTTTKTKLTANQWQNTPKQNAFMAAWLDPDSATFSNAYKSALAAGYNERYASQIASPAISNQWIQETQRLSKMTLEHLDQKLIRMINGPVDSKSPDDTRVKAIELKAKLSGLIDNKGTSTTNILVQPILNSASTKPLTVIDSEVVDDATSTQETTRETTNKTPSRDTYLVDQLIPE